MKKIILFIMEGVADKYALESILNKIFSDPDSKVAVANGDITSDYNTKPNDAFKNVKTKVVKIMKDYCNKNKITAKDIYKVIQIVDTDGAYILDNNIILDSNYETPHYNIDAIKINDIIKIKRRNEHKRINLDSLIKTNNLKWGTTTIDYEVYFMSCNLEHVLFDNANVLDDEKVDKADHFACTFENKENDFIGFISDTAILAPGDYAKTWDYIKKDNNSLQRKSNFHLVFKNIIKNQ